MTYPWGEYKLFWSVEEIPFGDRDKNFPDSTCLEHSYVINGNSSLKAKVFIKVTIFYLKKKEGFN